MKFIGFSLFAFASKHSMSTVGRSVGRCGDTAAPPYFQTNKSTFFRWGENSLVVVAGRGLTFFSRSKHSPRSQTHTRASNLWDIHNVAGHKFQILIFHTEERSINCNRSLRRGRRRFFFWFSLVWLLGVGQIFDSHKFTVITHGAFFLPNGLRTRASRWIMFVCTATRIYYPDEAADPGPRVARSWRVANDSQRANNFMINSKLAVSNDDDGRWLDVVVATFTRGDHSSGINYSERVIRHSSRCWMLFYRAALWSLIDTETGITWKLLVGMKIYHHQETRFIFKLFLSCVTGEHHHNN